MQELFLVTGTLIRGAKTWQEDTGALRGKPLKYNLYGVAAVGIAVKGCVGRPLSLRSAIARPVAQFKIWIERGGHKNDLHHTAFYGRPWLLRLYVSGLCRLVITGSDTDTSMNLYGVHTSLNPLFCR